MDVKENTNMQYTKTNKKPEKSKILFSTVYCYDV